ncbi:MAG: hypothetical protein DRJ97_05780 [Thermoprotei archaeon]|nr:MAG: hypothetical protein DRJ97_05780 [Thermoprotei archaeon]
MRVIVYTGKGGTGKSTISCATGIKAAEQGRDVLVISSDPAHTLMELFEVNIGPKPTKISDHLWAVQVDPIQEVREKYGVIQEYVAAVFKAKGLEETLAYELASLPNMTPFLSLLKVVDYFEEGGYDALILDTVPSGEALKNLYLPSLFGSISRKILRLAGSLVGAAKLMEPIVKIPAPSKEVIRADLKLLEKLEKLKAILTDPKTSSLRLVANPDFFSLSNLRRAYMTASLYNVNVDLAVINKVIPDEVVDPYFEEWRRSQAKYLAEAEVAFYPLPIKKVRLYRGELRGLDMLKTCGGELFGDEDPLKVYYEGRPFRLEVTEEGMELVVKTPFLDKERCEVERVGEELMIKVDTEVGEVRSFIPLPSIAYCMRLDRAKLIEGELHIYFAREFS